MARRNTTIALFALVLLFVPFALAASPPPIGDVRPGEVLEISFRERLSAAEVDEAGLPLFEADGFARPAAINAVDAYELWYLSSDSDGSPIRIFARMYVPVVRNSRQLPVLAFGSGTTGIGDQCAPSREVPEQIRWGWYDANMLAYAGQEIIGIFPDYTGFGEPAIPQRYFSRRAEAQLMLDAHRAVRYVFERQPGVIRSGARPGTAAFTAGYSQGGHAALATADLAPVYAPEIEIAGAIGFGSTNNVETLMREAAYYAPYILYSYREIYGVDRVNPNELIQQRWLPTLDADVLRMCVNEFQFYYPYDGRNLYTPAFYEALMADRLAAEYPELKAILDDNIAGLDGHRVPVLMVQGNEDIIVSNTAQRLFVDQLRAAGSEVDYEELAEVRHRHTRPAGFWSSVLFIKRHAP